MGRRVVAVATVVALGCLPVAAAAGAPVGGDAHAGSAAFGFWSVPSAGNVSTEVFVGGFEDVAPVPQSDAFVGVFQGWCDEASDEIVSRAFVNEADGGVAIQPLRSAAITGTFVLEGWEFRIPGCEEPRFEEATELELGSFPVEVSAQWTGRGAPDADAGVEPGGSLECGYAFAGAGTFREADVAGGIDGALPLAGGAEVAELPAEASFGELLTGVSTLAFTDSSCEGDL